MGGGYYDRDVNEADTSTGYSAAAATVVGVTQSLHSGLDPKRWEEEDMVCECKHPIVFALDVTGSMGDWTKIIYDKMPMFYGQLMMQKYLEEPSISFCAIGDAFVDKAPLQVTEFGEGKAIDQMLGKMWLEKGGGAGHFESYDLSAYFYANFVSLPNAEIPFFFVTGDEGYWDKTDAATIQKIFGKTLSGKGVNSDDQWKNLMTRYNVFLIKKPYKKKKEETQIKKQWADAIGNERILMIQEPKACVDVMLGAIAITSGARTMEQYQEDMEARGQTEARIHEVTEALRGYNQKFKAGRVKVIRNVKTTTVTQSTTTTSTATTVPVTITTSAETTTSVQVSANDIEEVRKEFENVFVSELDDEAATRWESLNELLNKEVPSGFLCPLTKKIMLDPVMIADGNSFERRAIELWFEKHTTSPLTGEELGSKTLVPNIAMKKLICDYEKKKKK